MSMQSWMCELCFPNAVEIKDFEDGLSLIYNGRTEKYSLLGGQGHNGDELIIFESKPTPDPYPQILDDDNWKTYEPTKEQEESSDLWWNMVHDIDWKMPPTTGRWFVEIMEHHGYGNNPAKEHNIFECWTYDFLGKIIKIYENSQSELTISETDL